MTRQFVQCVFREGDVRRYTYHQDLAPGVVPLKAGDTAQVEDPRGGWKKVKVVSASPNGPTFPTKPAKLYVPPPAKPEEGEDYSGEMPDGDGPRFDD